MARVSRGLVRTALKLFRNRQPGHIPNQDGCTCKSCMDAMEMTIERVLDEANKGWGYHRPVCAACQVEMRAERNGVGLLDMFNPSDKPDPQPYRIWDSDLYECPECHHQIVAGFGANPVASHFEPDFEHSIGLYHKNSIVIESRR